VEVVVGFERGVPVALDGRPVPLPELIRSLDALGGRYGFGRVDMVENRRVGIKSRELYEVPAALALIAAHRALEDLTLARCQAGDRRLLTTRYSARSRASGSSSRPAHVTTTCAWAVAEPTPWSDVARPRIDDKLATCGHGGAFVAARRGRRLGPPWVSAARGRGLK
jgi:hypothetical protein